ncbi:hypothetical protein CASFOL_005445 [Castilleja foliolosa]|uniref:Uncharacterized protein n=1 Tax=Castilleja foliolosa TaxID=1961234 RepID=A0ABD3E5G1_9LAMI
MSSDGEHNPVIGNDDGERVNDNTDDFNYGDGDINYTKSNSDGNTDNDSNDNDMDFDSEINTDGDSDMEGDGNMEGDDVEVNGIKTITPALCRQQAHYFVFS